VFFARKTREKHAEKLFSPSLRLCRGEGAGG
jgi:hypothetical protein